MTATQSTSTDISIFALLRAFTWVEVLVLLVTGGGLFFFPDLSRAQWSWTIAPFNARFVGAIYLGSLVSATFMALHGRWAPVRIVLPMILIFTSIVFGVSLLNLDKFDFQKWQPWAWFVLCTALLINSAYHLWLYRDRQPAEAHPTPSGWRNFLWALTVLLGLYGVALLIAPTTTSAFWPWPIEAFHEQMYSVVFITSAVGTYLIARHAASVEWQALGLTLLVVGTCSIVGLLLVNSTVPLEKKVDWLSSGTWIWMALMAVVGGSGTAIFLRAENLNKQI